MLDYRWPPVWETAVHLAVAGGVFDGVFLCCSFFPLDVSHKIWDVIESVSEGFLTYSCNTKSVHLSDVADFQDPQGNNNG